MSGRIVAENPKSLRDNKIREKFSKAFDL